MVDKKKKERKRGGRKVGFAELAPEEIARLRVVEVRHGRPPGKVTPILAGTRGGPGGETVLVLLRIPGTDPDPRYSLLEVPLDETALTLRAFAAGDQSELAELSAAIRETLKMELKP